MLDDPRILSALVAVVTVIALVVTALALLAYRRTRRGRFLLVGAGFGVVFLRGAWTSLALFTGASYPFLLGASFASDAVLLVLIYLGIVR